MLTRAHFDRGLRLDQYIASMTRNREDFRAYFVAAGSALSPEVLSNFRRLPAPVFVAALVEDDNLDALRDIPLLGRLCAEVTKLTLRLFRPHTHPEEAQALATDAGQSQAEQRALPIVGFYSVEFRLLAAHVQRLPALTGLMEKRRAEWIAAHPDVQDAQAPWERMSPITRIRLTCALYSLSTAERLYWWQQCLAAWQSALGLTPAGKGLT
ncbi:MAG: hypothetical protein RMM31_08445 [Anaerolineae bacterium]|nr:hypothetical protein [Anaerolineae bacterium]